MTIPALLLAACCAGASAPAAPEPTPPKAFELALRVGPTYALGQALPGALSDQRLGMEAAVLLHYRTRYFLTPFVEVGYATLGSGSAAVARAEPGGPATLAVRLDAWHVLAGLTFQIGPARIGVASGYYHFGLDYRLGGASSPTSAPSLGMDAYASVALFRAPRFFTTLDLVSHNGLTADLHYLQAAFTVHGDVLRF